MGWLDFYFILEKHKGNLNKITINELRNAAKKNPNEPITALGLAVWKYIEELEKGENN